MKVSLTDYSSLKSGPFTFFSGFNDFLSVKNLLSQSHVSDVHVMVPFVYDPLWNDLQKYKVQRVNGLRFPGLISHMPMKKELLKKLNLPLLSRINAADLVVFQSEASVSMWSWLYPEIKNSNYEVVYNFPGKTIPKYSRKYQPEKPDLIISAANWRPNLLPVEVQKIHSRWLANGGHSRIYGANKYMPMGEKWSDNIWAETDDYNVVAVTLDYFSACPNFVTEAISQGFPVVAPDSLGISELADKSTLFEFNMDPFLFGPSLFRNRQPMILHEDVSRKIQEIFIKWRGESCIPISAETLVCSEAFGYQSYLDVINLRIDGKWSQPL